jgi:hypothetical protein
MLVSLIENILSISMNVFKHVLVVSFTTVCLLGAMLVSEFIVDKYFNN